MKKFYSHGKVLLTAEYVVLDGVKALALPTTKGQSLEVSPLGSPIIHWQSYTPQKTKWIDADFDLKGSVIRQKNTPAPILKTLEKILKAFRALAPYCFAKGIRIETSLDFPNDWGLGSSSTLINNLAQWGNINAYELLDKTFGGSGYDIAAAQHDTPIFYRRNQWSPTVEPTVFSPQFKSKLFFVHLNQKQNSREAIASYQAKSKADPSILNRIEKIGLALPQIEEQKEFNALLAEHEQLIASLTEQKSIQEKEFPDFLGQLKSLGAWGGDFLLASGDATTPKYFSDKGYATVIPFKDFVLQA